MDSYAAGAAHRAQTYGPVQLLKGKLPPAPESTVKEVAAMDHASLLLTEALAAAHNAPDIRQDRVEALRAQIENGSYEIDMRRLAENLIRENPDLFDD